jgi:cytochrome c-type biogenesis protein CcmH
VIVFELCALLVFVLAFQTGSESSASARRMEERLLAPCCWRESLARHQSPQAETARAELRELIDSGNSEVEIIDIFVARYGERILREPRGGPAVWLTIVPILAIAAGTLLVIGYIVHLRRVDGDELAMRRLPSV